LNYKAYLQTEHWAYVRKVALERDGDKCQACGTKIGTIDVHHNTYDRLGEERLSDVVCLCRQCHELFHEAQPYILSDDSVKQRKVEELLALIRNGEELLKTEKLDISGKDNAQKIAELEQWIENRKAELEGIE